MTTRTSARAFRLGLCALTTGCLLTLWTGSAAAQPSGKAKAPRAGGGLIYTFVNKTGGKFTDDQCYWSLNGGREWHSFAKEPTVPCPGGNGRLYFRLGAAPKNVETDRAAYWDFIEYAYGGKTWNGNTTQVDAFCIPLTIELGSHKVGITESRKKLFDEFRKNAPKEFQGCVKDGYWIVAPCRGGGFELNEPNATYFDKYVDEVWNMYAKEKPTPSGKFIGKVVNGALTFTPVGGGKGYTLHKKPSTQDIFLGEHELAGNPNFCAAFNRHVAADPADWRNPSKFYQALPCNWYSKFLHEHAINHRAYGFCYDDVSEQAAFFSGQGDNLIVTIYWDTPPAQK